MNKDVNLRRQNSFEMDINIVRHNLKTQSPQNDLRKQLSRGNLHYDVKCGEPIADMIRNALTKLKCAQMKEISKTKYD